MSDQDSECMIKIRNTVEQANTAIATTSSYAPTNNITCSPSNNSNEGLKQQSPIELLRKLEMIKEIKLVLFYLFH